MHTVKHALVLGGGGAKGAFQVGVLLYLYERGVQWDVVAGQSVGAVNGAMVACEAIPELVQIWLGIERSRIYRRVSPLRLFRLLFGRVPSILDNTPFRHVIRDGLEGKTLKMPFHCGAISLESGDYIDFAYPAGSAPDPEVVVASASIPCVWSPVPFRLSSGTEHLVDGGIRELSPIGRVIAYKPEEITVINCSPRQLDAVEGPWSFTKVLMRTLSTVSNDNFTGDMSRFLDINDEVLCVERHNAQLPVGAAPHVYRNKKTGRPYRYFSHNIYEPEPLGSSLDFDPRSIRRKLCYGINYAAQRFGASIHSPSLLANYA